MAGQRKTQHLHNDKVYIQTANMPIGDNEITNNVDYILYLLNHQNYILLLFVSRGRSSRN